MRCVQKKETYLVRIWNYYMYFLIRLGCSWKGGKSFLKPLEVPVPTFVVETEIVCFSYILHCSFNPNRIFFKRLLDIFLRFPLKYLNNILKRFSLLFLFELCEWISTNILLYCLLFKFGQNGFKTRCVVFNSVITFECISVFYFLRFEPYDT